MTLLQFHLQTLCLVHVHNLISEHVAADHTNSQPSSSSSFPIPVVPLRSQRIRSVPTKFKDYTG